MHCSHCKKCGNSLRTGLLLRGQGSALFWLSVMELKDRPHALRALLAIQALTTGMGALATGACVRSDGAVKETGEAWRDGECGECLCLDGGEVCGPRRACPFPEPRFCEESGLHDPCCPFSCPESENHPTTEPGSTGITVEYPKITEPPNIAAYLVKIKAKHPMMTTGPKQITAELPQTTTESPTITIKRLKITTEPTQIAEPPKITTKSQKITKESPQTTEEPQKITTEPPKIKTERPVITEPLKTKRENSEITTASTQITTGSPEISREPHIITAEPSRITESPKITTERPMIAKGSTHITTVSLKITIEPPKRTTLTPKITTETPQLTAELPKITTKRPTIITEPLNLTTEPQEITTRPLVMPVTPHNITSEIPDTTTRRAAITTEPSKITTEPQERTNKFPIKTAERTTVVPMGTTERRTEPLENESSDPRTTEIIGDPPVTATVDVKSPPFSLFASPTQREKQPHSGCVDRDGRFHEEGDVWQDLGNPCFIQQCINGQLEGVWVDCARPLGRHCTLEAVAGHCCPLWNCQIEAAASSASPLIASLAVPFMAALESPLITSLTSSRTTSSETATTSTTTSTTTTTTTPASTKASTTALTTALTTTTTTPTSPSHCVDPEGEFHANGTMWQDPKDSCSYLWCIEARILPTPNWCPVPPRPHQQCQLVPEDGHCCRVWKCQGCLDAEGVLRQDGQMWHSPKDPCATFWCRGTQVLSSDSCLFALLRQQ